MHGVTRTAKVLDDIKHLGYSYSTKGAITVAVAEIKVQQKKKKWLNEGDVKGAIMEKSVRGGVLGEDERYRAVISI